MMNYLICDTCNYKNVIYTERVVFCSNCRNKMKNNYLDWKKSNNQSLETYINEVTTIDGTQKKLIISSESIDNNRNIFYLFKRQADIKTRIFIAATMIQLLIFSVIMFSQDNGFEISEHYIQANKNYLEEIKWGNYSISQEIAITLPFELKKSETVLPNYLSNYISVESSSKSESSESFSVTIEEFDMNDNTNFVHRELLYLKDEYMKTPSVYFTSNDGHHHLNIKKYQTDMQHGSYISNKATYLYDNYTLTKGNKVIKIIVSYLQDDDLLNNYADIVSQSILNNKQLI